MIKFIQITFNNDDYSLEDILISCQQYYCLESPALIVENNFVAQTLENNLVNSTGAASYNIYTSITQFINHLYLQLNPDAVMFNLGDLQYIIYNYLLTNKIADINLDLVGLFKLAKQLQVVFIDYIYYRSQELIDIDNKQKHSFPKWQLDLWLYIKKYVGNKVLFTNIYQQFMIIDDSKLTSILKTNIYLYNINSVYPAQLSILNKLSSITSVYWLYLSISNLYYGDMQPFALSKKTKSTNINSLEDLYLEDIHPLVSNLALQAREFLELLINENIAINILEEIVTSSSKKQQLLISNNYTILEIIQQDIAQLLISNYSDCLDQDELGNYYDHIDQAGNKALSFKIYQCYTKLQEVEVIADKILYLLNNDSSLQLSDFIVIAPNIADYADYINMVFTAKSKIGSIPYNLETKLVSQNSVFVDLFKSILSLDYKFTSLDLINILKYELVMKHLDLSYDDVNEIENWLADNNIFFNTNSNQDISYSYYNSFHYLQKKLALGYCIASKNIDYQLSDMSYDVEFNSSLLNKFLNFLSTIVNIVNHIYDGKGQLVEFNNHLPILELINMIITNITGNNIILDQITIRLKQTYIAKFNISILKSMVDDQDQQASNLYLSGGITCISLDNFSSCKKQVIMLIGMNASQYPRINNHNVLNVLNQSWSLSDKNKNIDDKYHFLNTILLAQKYLIISFNQENSDDHQSALLDLLIEVVANTFNLFDANKNLDLRNIITKYSCNNINSLKNLISYSDEYNQDYSLIKDTTTNKNRLANYKQKQLFLDIKQLASCFLYTNANYYHNANLASFITINAEVKDLEYLDFDNKKLRKSVINKLNLYRKYHSDIEIYNYLIKGGWLNSNSIMANLQFENILKQHHLTNIDNTKTEIRARSKYKNLNIIINAEIIIDHYYNVIVYADRGDNIYSALVYASIIASMIASQKLELVSDLSQTLIKTNKLLIYSNNLVLVSLNINSYQGLLNILINYYFYSQQHPILINKNIINDTLLGLYIEHHNLSKNRKWKDLNNVTVNSGYNCWDQHKQDIALEIINNLNNKLRQDSSYNQDYDDINNQLDGIWGNKIEQETTSLLAMVNMFYVL